MIRFPAVAGSFYERSKEHLITQINDSFISKFGPGKLPEKKFSEKINAIIVPHAGYFFSGACAAYAYKNIAESKSKKFILIGPNHYGFESGLSELDWETPLGIAKIDKKLFEEIKEKTDLEINENTHKKEHSLEVQIPFLQYVKKDFTIVPISLGNIGYSKLGNDLFKIIKDEEICIIISSDFTHYGSNFGYMPFTNNIKQNLSKLDGGAIELIRKFDLKGFQNYLDETKITICGYMPILVLLSLAQNYKDKKAELLKYYTSGDVLGDSRNSVSYASISFEFNK